MIAQIKTYTLIQQPNKIFWYQQTSRLIWWLATNSTKVRHWLSMTNQSSSLWNRATVNNSPIKTTVQMNSMSSKLTQGSKNLSTTQAQSLMTSSERSLWLKIPWASQVLSKKTKTMSVSRSLVRIQSMLVVLARAGSGFSMPSQQPTAAIMKWTHLWQASKWWIRQAWTICSSSLTPIWILGVSDLRLKPCKINICPLPEFINCSLFLRWRTKSQMARCAKYTSGRTNWSAEFTT